MGKVHPDLTMKRIMPGLHDGNILRAEREFGGDRWRFEMLMRPLNERLDWHEHSPQGSWTPIGTWPTLKAGQKAAEALRRGTHYWDGKDKICRPYTEDVYAALRGQVKDN